MIVLRGKGLSFNSNDQLIVADTANDRITKIIVTECIDEYQACERRKFEIMGIGGKVEYPWVSVIGMAYDK